MIIESNEDSSRGEEELARRIVQILVGIQNDTTSDNWSYTSISDVWSRDQIKYAGIETRETNQG